MLRTFNCGVGFILVAAQKDKEKVMEHVKKWYACYEIGKMEKGRAKIIFENSINWL
ncbi:MAG: AIR synthase-related protein [Bacteroidales bacterium]|nr:AIR synthase-related protein [Clostridium sp.]MCM1203744.1 AIR synthase-related protein [Bacteroidales bacterium]